MNTGTPIYSLRDGMIVASQSGVLGFRTTAGNIVYLLHGYCVGAFCTVGQAVHVGDELITSACVPPAGGSCTGPHLHFEVHTSIVGELSVTTGPGDDINPEPWFTSPTSRLENWVGQNANGALDVFATNPRDAAAWNKVQSPPSSGSWLSWSSLGGGLASEPSVGANVDGTIGVAAIGATSPPPVIYNQQTAPSTNSWLGWYNLGGSTLGTPSVGTNQNGNLVVFVRGAQYVDPWGNVVSSVFYRAKTGPGQTAWSAGWTCASPYTPGGACPGGLVSDVAVAMNTDGTIELFGEGPNGYIWYTRQSAPNSDTWTGWNLVSNGVLAAAPAVARNANGALQLLAIGPAGGVIWTTRQPSAGIDTWPAWCQVPNGSLASSPGVGTNLDGTLDVFAYGPTGAVWHDRQTSPSSDACSGWTGWYNIQGAASSVPSVMLNTGGWLSAFVVDPASTLRCLQIDWAYQTSSSPPPGTWSAWQSLGCP